MDKVVLLGHIVSNDRIGVDRSNIEVVLQWSLPKIVTGVRSFLGLAGYYRRFVEGFFEDCNAKYIVNL